MTPLEETIRLCLMQELYREINLLVRQAMRQYRDAYRTGEATRTANDNFLKGKMCVLVDIAKERAVTGVERTYNTKVPMITVDRVDYDPRYHEIVGDA